jgi:hypothetical protein
MHFLALNQAKRLEKKVRPQNDSPTEADAPSV